MKTRWGIDLGGTKIEGVVLEADNLQNTLCRIRVPTEQEGGHQHILQQVQKLVHMMQTETGLTPDIIGMGTPGTTDPSTGLLKNSNTVVLNGQPVQRQLQELIGPRFILSNDANCFAIAEATLGAVANLDHVPEVVIGLILGTGVGSGVVINGKVLQGIHGIAGEWGHNTLIPDGNLCYCGKKGCVETVISGPALQRHYKAISGSFLKMPEIVAKARGGTDTYATQTLQRLVTYFGKAIANIINVLDPEVIVIGGGVGNIDELYTEGAAATLPYVFNPELKTKFMRPRLGDSAGVFGAAMLT